MSYQVLARKWRPQTFDAVVGQDAITRTLRNALAAGRIAHAYLFAGPRGCGKTTTARLVARALLCPARQGAEACGTCTVCQDAQAGVAVDLIEIDAASNRRIEDVRTLRENVKYAPSRGRYKVYIVDEVHQLTHDSFDALLKTLEEPPAHVVFILATTDPRDLPPTILSRVQRFDFRPIPADLLSAALERILEEERVPFEAAALPTVVRAAEGSLRDALSLLDTAIAYGNGRLDAETVATLLGVTAPAEVRAFAEALVAQDTTAALEAVDRAAREGEDLGAFARDVVERLRRAMVLKAAPTAKLTDLTPAEGNELRKLGDAATLDELLYLLRAFVEADALMRESPQPRVELEMAAVRATRRPIPRSIEEVLKRVDAAEARLRQQAPAASPMQESLPGAPGPVRAGSEPRRPVAPSSPPAAAPSAPAPSPESVPDRASAPPPASATERPWTPRPEPARPVPSAPTAAPVTPEAGDVWQRMIEDVMKKKPTLGAVLMHARPGPLEGRELTVVLTGTHFHRETLADLTNREVILQAIRRNFPGVEGFTVVSGDAGRGITEHPAVQAAIIEFQGEVVAVRPRSPEGEGQ